MNLDMFLQVAERLLPSGGVQAERVWKRFKFCVICWQENIQRVENKINKNLDKNLDMFLQVAERLLPYGGVQAERVRKQFRFCAICWQDNNQLNL